MTLRLFHADAYLREFDATVVEARPAGDRVAILLDRTAFYPTSGGQPHDIGTLNDVRVLDVVEDGESVLHITDAPVAGQVTGRIDWPRRFDHMQQHTGQHILSQAFLQTVNAQTRAVHLGEELNTLDLDTAEFSAEQAARVEDLANGIVFENRPVVIHEVDEDDLPALGLRRPAKKRGRIRVVEVEGFDRSACGGTHVRHAGEVGLIKLRRWERFKGGARVEFICGWRALRDYRWKNALVMDLAGKFTVKDREVGDAVTRLSVQMRERDRFMADLRDRLVALEAQQRLAAAPGPVRVVATVLDGWTLEMASALAGRLIGEASVVAALATLDGRIMVGRSADVALDAGAVLKRVVEPRGGRGGGRPEFAQGAVPPANVHEALEALRSEVVRSLA